MTDYTENIISFKNVGICFQSKGKEVNAVKEVSLDICKGEIFGIVGASGAGKSTLLRTINLLQRPTTGHVIVNGTDITRLKGEALRKLRTNIGMIFQQFNLIHTKTVFDNVAFAMKAVNKSKEEIRQRVPEMLNLVGLSDKAQSHPSKLSGGEKQRVGIARALANNPYILLCDEPTSALDMENTNAILKLLKEINERLNITTVIISHEINVIKKICNRVAVMSRGKVIETDQVFNVFTNPRETFTQKLVSHTLDLDIPEYCFASENFKILKVTFNGKSAEDALISDTIKRFDIDLNILHGKIEYIQNKPFGILIVKLTGSPDKITSAEKYLLENAFQIEVITKIY
ncbi:MAG: ATP-binding cassette domain-containing protein [Tannerella sp.]|nr:ATP-binding cassette domain-containing protein [Tannerella sp.]